VLVNGKAAGAILWEPNTVDITDFLGDDAAPLELGIEVIGHRRNSHGPLHHTEKWPVWTGPSQFTTAGGEWTDSYQLVPCGLAAPPFISITSTAFIL
jgi:hypothetical protein